jgi:cytochrome P450
MKASLPRFSYFQFGGCPRSCIGELFTWTEELLVIAIIAMHWKMRLESGHPVILQPFV